MSEEFYDQQDDDTIVTVDHEQREERKQQLVVPEEIWDLLRRVQNLEEELEEHRCRLDNLDSMPHSGPVGREAW